MNLRAHRSDVPVTVLSGATAHDLRLPGGRGIRRSGSENSAQWKSPKNIRAQKPRDAPSVETWFYRYHFPS